MSKNRSKEEQPSGYVPVVDVRAFHNASPSAIRKEFRFYLKTVQSGSIKTMIDAIKEVVVDVNIIFDAKGMLIRAFDNANNAFVKARLNADRFEYYVCGDEKVTCGVSLIHLFTCLKTMSSTDILMMYMKKGENRLKLRIENNRKPKTSKFTLDTLDLPLGEFKNIDDDNDDDDDDDSSKKLSNEAKTPLTTISKKSPITTKKPEERAIVGGRKDTGKTRKWEFDHIISIDASEFHKIIRESKNIGPSLEIQFMEKELRFSVIGGSFAEASFSVGVEESSQKSTKLYQGVFSINYLVLFTKCSPLSKHVNLHLKNDFPLWLAYDVSDLGTIQLVLANEEDPRSTDNPHYSYK